jgi:hypothetical protein
MFPNSVYDDALPEIKFPGFVGNFEKYINARVK